MASFGKLNTSLIQGVNENTLALANLNFDFSLVKVQAPPEFQQIGPALAEQRRQNAEAGNSHQTARKLGALFESLIPPIPRVIAAYGQRASEIMKRPDANPTGTTEQHGPFAAFVGADATGIWAAATSGQASIATHLLACMLARTFNDPAKAVSVWVELVHERKHEIMAYNTRSTLSMAEIAALNASIQQVAREELRLWDASARAWLQTADSAMGKEHVQLKLVIKNISIPVMAGTSLYASVTKAWTQALVGVERLIAGEPQSVTSGAILLAISAWHLYPDLLVFTSQTTSVTFGDCLMSPSGVLTVGITNAACTSTGKEGIYWSVALSHYRHYGRPTKAISEVGDRLTMDELYVVTLGGLLKSWGEPRATYEQASKWFLDLWNCVNKEKDSLPGPAWLKPLAGAASTYLQAEKQERKELLSLMDFGFRRGAQFLAPRTRKSVNLPWFGLRSPHIMESLGRSSSKDCAIEYLRQTAAACKLNPYKALITVVGVNSSNMGLQLLDYYTALPILHSQSPNLPKKLEKASLLATDSNPNSPCSWDGTVSVSNGESGIEEASIQLKHRSWRGSFPLKGDKSYGVPSSQNPQDISDQLCSDPITLDGLEATIDRGWIKNPLQYRDPQFVAEETVTICGVTLLPLEGFSKSDIHFGAVVGEETNHFNLWISPEDFYARPVRQIIKKLSQGKGQPLMDLQASRKRLKRGINRYLLWQYLEGAPLNDPDESIRAVLSLMRWERSYWEETVKSLRNLAAAYDVYKKLEGATISSTIVTRGIHDAKWGLAGSEGSLNRSSAFSCIAAMETGTVNLEAKRFDHILALASGNSIYMLRHFITDPAVQVSSTDIVRIVGNVGRAGISLLITPTSEPLMRPLSNSLRAVTYANFDGKKENNFTGTSLHLSFTPHEFPLDYGVSGIMDHQIFYVESVISVHDSGKWVADLDILQALYSGVRQVLKMPKWDPLKKPHDHTNEETEAALDSFVSIDTWEEVLDGPPTHSLVRASDNWAARLAVLAVISQNAAHGPKFAADSDEERVLSKEKESDVDDDEEGGGRKEEEGGEYVGELNPIPVRMAILENREDVCWVCMHKRLTKKGWLASQDPCYIVV